MKVLKIKGSSGSSYLVMPMILIAILSAFLLHADANQNINSWHA